MPDHDAMMELIADDLLARSVIPIQCPASIGAGGRYHLTELIGATPRAAIYLAQDRTLSTQSAPAHVIVKVLSGDRVDEASFARRVRHPNVVIVFDAGVTDDGLPFVVTEYVPQGDLGRTALPWNHRRATAEIARLADAVHTAHARGVMHCDLKPGNVLVADDGTLKLTDFDLAKPIEPFAAAERGTPAFAAPEQLGADAVGALPLSDVYGLAGIMFWLLTSTAPNGSDGLPRTDHRSLLQAAATPPRLAEIILRSLQSEPERRHGSAQEFADDLRRWLDDAAIPWLPSSASDSVRRSVRRHPVRAVLLSLVGIVAVLGAASGAILWRSEETRRIQALEDRLAAAQAELNDTHRSLRNELHTVGEALMTRAATARESELLAALAWLERLGDASLIGPNGDRIPIAYQRDALFELVRRLDAAGQGGSMRAALAKDALARAQEELGNRDEAARLFGEIEAAWAARLDSGDPFLGAVRSARRRCTDGEGGAADGRTSP
jgi:hypothetical protein